jgi:hypothetical protein
VTGSAYHRTGNLATHPAFSFLFGGLTCRWPGCKEPPIQRASDYDRHYLAHNPDADHAWQWLSGKTYKREAARRGWPSFDEMLSREGLPHEA